MLVAALSHDVEPRTPPTALTPGDPWKGFPLRDVPLIPAAAPLSSAATATRPIDVWRLSNELVAPAEGVVVSRWSRRIVAASLTERRAFFMAGLGDWLRRVTKVHLSSVSQRSTLLAPGRRYFYHAYVDVVSRICAFGLPGLAETEVQVLHHGPMDPLMRFLMERLRPANVTFRALDSPDLIRVEELVFPTFPAWNFSGWLPNWYLTQLRQALLPDRPSRRSERICIVRRGRRRLLNQDLLLDRLRRHGFYPVVLEELSFGEQIRIFHDAEAIVATHGAGLTNLLFATGALVVEIFPTSAVVPHFLLMAASLDHHHRYVLGTNTQLLSDFETNVAAVEREVVIGLEDLR